MKTLEELNALPDDELRAMLSNILNWELFKGVQPFMWGPKYKLMSHDYPQDLNACHEVEATLKASGKVEFNESLYYSQQTFYICNLADVLQGSPAGTFSWPAYGLNAGQAFEIANATARQRTIALIFTLQAQ